MESVLFISNKIYHDNSKQEGGVKACTREYISLISRLYNIILFEVETRRDFKYKILLRLGLNVYNDYFPKNYLKQIIELIKKNNIKIIFLNMSNTSYFAQIIKQNYNREIKIILCSHGNESGDFLHEIVRFKSRLSSIKKITSSFTLGHLVKKESYYRIKFLDLILTVSEIEEAMEKWIGAREVLLIPRVIEDSEISKNYVLGRVGFVGDLSHSPNFYGIDEVCKSLSNNENSSNIQVRIVGSPVNIGEEFAQKYPFVNYTGYLNNDELISEVSTWCFFLNPVFYYSRGVSTKLAKPLGWVLPVISTSIGCRGYKWNDGRLIIADTPNDFADKIIEYSTNQFLIDLEVCEIKKIVASMPTLTEISFNLNKSIQNLM